jgi:hypothetical protein
VAGVREQGDPDDVDGDECRDHRARGDVPRTGSSGSAGQLHGGQLRRSSGLPAAASAAAHAGSWIWNTLVPVGFSIAMHSGAKNTAEWLRMGLQLFWPAGRPPVR